VGTDAAGIAGVRTALAAPPRTPYMSLRISIARPFEAISWGKTVDGWLPRGAYPTVLNEKTSPPQCQKIVSRVDLSYPPLKGVDGLLTYPPLEGEGRREAAGWGDLSTATLFGMRDLHPTPAHISLRSCDPTLPLQGRVSKRARNDARNSNTPPRSRGAIRPSFILLVPPSPNRGRRECRAPGAPAAARAKVESRKHTR
jgi:hypothetical protein